MRYILAIAGLLAAIVLAVGVYLFLPHPAGPSPSLAQSTVTAPAPATTTPNQPAASTGETGTAENGDGSLRVCNETGNQVSIALGYRAAKGWQSEGWWVAGPTECKTVYNGRLDARYYYIFAADDIGGGVWDGTNYMCTRDETFTIFGVEDCLARGYERTGFFEVDTQNKPNWTLQLTDGDVVSGETDASGDSAPLESDAPSDDAEPGDIPPDDNADAPTSDETPTDEGAAPQ